jgi:hypothetical protein
MKEAKLGEADAIADQVLAIEEQPNARMIKWAVCAAREDKTAAQIHLDIVKKTVPKEVLGMLVEQNKACINKLKNEEQI